MMKVVQLQLNVKEFMDEIKCPECEEAKKGSLFFKINEKNIAELCDMDISQMSPLFDNLNSHYLTNKAIAGLRSKEIKDRFFLMNVGLNYLALSRSSSPLAVKHNASD
jgi:excinuclease ABC subunit A